MENVILNNNLLEMTDEELMAIFQDNNDSNAYNQLCLRYKDKLINFLYRFTGNRQSAEDLTQDTLLKVYFKKDSYKEIAKFSTWMYTIGSNLAKTELRKIKRRKTHTFTDLGSEEYGDFQPPDTSYDPNNKEEDTEITDELIKESLLLLDDEFRLIVLLRDIQELSYEEISKILQIPLGTVKSRINRARLKLREILKQKGVTRY